MQHWYHYSMLWLFCVNFGSIRLLPSSYTLLAEVSCTIKSVITSQEKSVTKHLKIIFCGIFTQITTHTISLKHFAMEQLCWQYIF